MRGILAIASMWIAAGAICHAEPRWCSITSLGPNQILRYPPLARAAQVQGHVMERVIYSPGGGATSFEFISGPRMLSDSLERQMTNWTLKTSAGGDAPCVTLVIVDFEPDQTLGGESVARPINVSVPSILQMHVNGSPLIISDPSSGYLSKPPLSYRIGHAIRSGFRKLFGLRR